MIYIIHKYFYSIIESTKFINAIQLSTESFQMQKRIYELNILLFRNAYFDRINCQLSIVYVRARIFLICRNPSVDNIKNIKIFLNGFVILNGDEKGVGEKSQKCQKI